MKKTVILILFLFTMVFGQINLEHRYANGWVQYVKLKNSGEKYYLFDKNSFTLKIYNLDHSVYKSINIPVAYDGYTPWYVSLVSEGLFTNNDLICFLAMYTSNDNLQHKSRIITSNGSSADVLMTLDSCYSASVVQTAQGTKLITNEYVDLSTTMSSFSKVYSLPSSLPAAVAESSNMPNRIEIGQSYPNPVNGTISIPYELPAGEREATLQIYNALGQEVLNFRVDNNFRNLQLSSDRLSAGTYIYNLRTAGNISESKRFTVTK